MATLPEKVRALGVDLRHWRQGNHKTVCPKCSHTRRKKRDPCLSVTVEPDKALIHCWHCGWGEAVFEDGNNGTEIIGQRYRMGRKARPQRLDLGTAGRRQRYGLDAT